MDVSDVLRCESVHEQNASSRCEFVHNNADCQCSEGFFNYIDFIYCDNIHGDVTKALAIYSVWSCFLFFVLGLTAESFFCPSLVVISRSLSLSQNVAIFLAFGNGASDIFASLAAATQNRPELVISGLFGAGIFVTCAVAGAIMIATQFKINEVAFLRDIIFYLGAAYWAFAVYYNGRVRPVDAFGFLGLYLLYIMVVLFAPYFHRKLHGLYGLKYDELGEPSRFCSSVSTIPVYCTPIRSKEIICNGFQKSEITPLLRHPLLKASNANNTMTAKLKNLRRALSPFDAVQWKTAVWYWRVLIAVKAPAIFILKLSVPLIDYDLPSHNWSQLLNAFHCIIGPCFLVFATRSEDLSGHVVIADAVSIWVVVLVIGIVGALAVLLTSSDHEKPKYHSVFGYFGFVTSIVWIYIMANEIVNVLKVIGIVLNINDAILGLTILAWGNSIGDFVANFSVAREGSPMMGISACYGGPLFNLLVGMGLPFTIETFRRQAHIKVIYDPSVTILSIFLFTSLLSTMFAMLFTKFQVQRRYGFYLLFLYVAFVVCAIYNAAAFT